MSVTDRRTPPSPTSRPNLPRRLAVDAVLAGLTLPLAAVVAADALNPQWDWVEAMASHFVHGRAGWLIPAALVSLAVASAALLWMAAPWTRGGRVGLWLLGIWSGCVLTAGIFPADPYGQWDRPLTLAGAIHGVAGLTAFAVLPVAAVLLTRIWRRDLRWQAVAHALAVAVGIAVVAYLVFLVVSIDVVTDGPALHVGPFYTVAGLAERVMLWAYVAWLATAATGLRRISADR